MKIRSEALPYTSYLPCSNIEVQIYMYNLSRISLHFSYLSNTPIITKATPMNAFKSRVNWLPTSDGLGILLPIQEVSLVMTPPPPWLTDLYNAITPGITLTEVNCNLHLKHIKDNAEHIHAGVCIYFTGVNSILICTNNIYRTTTTEWYSV